jgi:hypothetical protein
MMRIDDVVVFMGVSLEKISPVRQTNSPLVPNRSFQFEKRCQLFVRTDNETLSVAVRVNIPDRSPLRING